MNDSKAQGEAASAGPEVFDPFAHFNAWLAEAEQSEPNDPNAMAVATVDEDGLPNVRTVLLKGVSEQGLAFYTNFESAKGRELSSNRKAAVLFHWKTLRRQVRVRGPVNVVSDQEADAYFTSRARQSQLGAWASQQSRPLETPDALERAIALASARFDGQSVKRPPHWSGFVVAPVYFEFWRERQFRLHERIVLTRTTPDAPWAAARLYP